MHIFAQRRSEFAFKYGVKNGTLPSKQGALMASMEAMKASVLALVDAGLLPITALPRKHALSSETPVLVRVCVCACVCVCLCADTLPIRHCSVESLCWCVCACLCRCVCVCACVCMCVCVTVLTRCPSGTVQ